MAKAAPIDGLDADSPLGLAARRALAVRLAELRALEPVVALRCSEAVDRLAPSGLSDEVEAVHDLRVATRRLRAALTLFGLGHDPARAEVKRLGDALGKVRDLDVQLAWLSSVLASGQLAPPERAGIEKLAEERRLELGPRERALGLALSRWSEEVAPRLEQSFAELDEPGRFGGKALRRRLRKRLRRLERRLEATLASNDPRTAHQLRKTTKKLRYQAELFAPARPEAIAPLLAALEPLQDTVGELHDRDVRAPLVERFLVRAGPSEQPGLIALLREDLAERDRLAAELALELRRFRSERLLHTLRAGLK